MRLEGPHTGLFHISIHLHSPHIQTPVNTLCCRRQKSPGTFQSPWVKFPYPEASLEQPVPCHNSQGPHHAAELIVLSRKAAKPLHLPARPQGTGLGSARKPWGASTFLPTHAAVRSNQKSPRLLQPTASHNVALSRVSGKMEEAPLPKTGKECAATALSQAGGVRWGMAAAATWGAVRNA